MNGNFSLLEIGMTGLPTDYSTSPKMHMYVSNFKSTYIIVLEPALFIIHSTQYKRCATILQHRGTGLDVHLQRLEDPFQTSHGCVHKIKRRA